MSHIQEPEALAKVKKFHELFDHYIWEKPSFPSAKMCQLRVNLLQEELDEFKQAIADGDLVEVADALVDMQYVLSWAVLSFGMQDIFADMFDEVQRSNMSKVCKTLEEAERTVKYHANRKWENKSEWEIVEKSGMYMVLRKSDKKVLKSVDYSPAKLDTYVKYST